MVSKGANALLSRASRIRTKLQGLEASSLVVEDVSYQHAGHAAVKDGAQETHFNVKIVSEKFNGHSLVKRHQMIYGLLNDELQSGLHALSIVAKTPQEAVQKYCYTDDWYVNTRIDKFIAAYFISGCLSDIRVQFGTYDETAQSVECFVEEK